MPDISWDLLNRWKTGLITDAEMQAALTRPATGATPEALVDLNRLARCGAPEVVYAPGKSAQGIIDTFSIQHANGQSSFATRVTPEQADSICMAFPNASVNVLARTVAHHHPSAPRYTGQVAVLAAGSSDRPIAEEAAETARWLGCEAKVVLDVGVAGPHRLMEQYPKFADAAAIVVVAGMEGALPSVVGGWVSVPVIAVPTSVGYGANLGGITPLFTMLSSCAANVAVVNIDAGFKGGYLAGLIARREVVSR